MAANVANPVERKRRLTASPFNSEVAAPANWPAGKFRR